MVAAAWNNGRFVEKSCPKFLIDNAATAGLSMWMSNSATAALMVPLIQPIILELREGRVQELHSEAEMQSQDGEADVEKLKTEVEMQSVDGESDVRELVQRDNGAKQRFSKCLMLGVV